MAVAIAATVLGTYPPRVQLSITGLTIGNVVTVSRVLSGARTAVRGASAVTVADTALVVDDAEFPFGQSLTWVATVNNADAATTGATTVTLAGARAILTDAVAGTYATVKVVDWPEWKRTRDASVFNVGGRNVVVARPRSQFTAQTTLKTEANSERDALNSLLDSATEATLQLRQDGTYPDMDAYLSVLSDSRQRVTKRSTDQTRLWDLDVVEVEAWAPALPTAGFTFADFDTAYSGLTFADFDTDFAGKTFLDFDLTDWS